MSGTPTIAWDDGGEILRNRSPQYVPIYQTPLSGKLKVIILGEKVEGVLTHFIDKATVPHIEPVHLCTGCSIGQWPRWAGYIVVSLQGTNRIGLLHVTEDCMKSVIRDHGEGVKWRGKLADCYRQGNRKNSRMRLEFTGEFRHAMPAKIPLVKDVLQRLWYCGKNMGKRLPEGD